MSLEHGSGAPEGAENFVAPDESLRVNDPELAHAKAIAGDYFEEQAAFFEHRMKIANELGLKGETSEQAKGIDFNRVRANSFEDDQNDTDIETEYRDSETKTGRLAKQIQTADSHLQWLYNLRNYRRIPKGNREKLETIIKEHKDLLRSLSDRLSEELDRSWEDPEGSSREGTTEEQPE